LPTCIDPAIAATYYPPIKTTSSSECPVGQVKVLGYKAPVTPALSGSLQVLPSALREATAPRFGPVNTYSGALSYSTDDLAVEDAGRRITATRLFRSDRLGAGDVGRGWTSSYGESLSDLGGLATLSMSDGTAVDFVTDPAAGYVPAPGVTAGFSKDANGTTITTNDRVSYQFNPAGELTGMRLGDDGHELVVQRSDGQVDRVTGASGRFVVFTRSGGKLTRVADQTGRDVDLSYDGDRLAGAQGVDGHTESYTYDAGGRLTRVTTPEGRVKLAVGYRADGRVEWLEEQGRGRATFGYDTNSRRTVTLADGSVISQEYDWAGRLVTERLGRTGTHVVYDGEGRIVSKITGVPDVPMTGYGPSAPVTFLDGKGDPVLEVDPTGRYSTTTFNARHHPLVTTFGDDSSVTRVYDGQGRLVSLTDPRGKVWQYTYNGRGQLLTLTDPLDRTRTIAYEADGDVASVTDETGATTAFGSDVHGRRTVTIDPLDRRLETAHTAWDQLRQVTRPRGGSVTTAFDDDRLPISTTDALGKVTSYEYDTAGRPSAVQDPLGGGTVTAYDGLGRPIRVTDARGSIFRQSYTTEGWVATSTDPLGKVTTFEHDPAGRVYRQVDALGQVTQYAHDRAGRVTNVWTPDGAQTKYGYDKRGRQSTLTTPRGKVWKTEYDPAGRITKTIDPLTYTVTAGYDDVGRLVARTDQNGVATTVAYNDSQRATTVSDPVGVRSVTTFDAAGQVASETDGEGGQTSYGYDGDGNLDQVDDPAGSWRFEYDLAGWMTAQNDPLDRRTTAGYDDLGRLTLATHPDQTTTGYGYDQVGNLISHTDRTGAVWEYTYDAGNRLTTATDPLDHATTYTYDELGRQTSVIDPAGVVTNQAYDPVGRPAVTWDATGASWATQYDLDGNVAKTIDPAGVIWQFIYNDRGELTRKQWGAPTAAVHDYTYDKVGRLLTAKEPYQTTFEYDDRGRVAAQTNGVGDRTAFGYDDADRLTTQTSPGLHASTWTYDAAGRLDTATDPLNHTSSYDWDPAGQLETITLPRGGTYTYGYDAAGRVEFETDPLNHTTQFAYDGEGRPTTASYPSGRTITTGYDLAGRVTTQTAGGDVRTFGYDDAGRFVSATATGVPALGFGYDDRGLLTHSSNSFGDTTYGYDAAHRLATATPPVGPATTYTYDTRGLLATVRGAINANFTGYDGAGRLKSRIAVSPSTSGTETRTYDTAGRLSNVNGPVFDATLTYHPDGQIATTTGSGTNPKIKTYAYDDAGRLTTETITQDTSTLSTATYGWDADGNRTSVSRDGQPAVTADYDLADRLNSSSDGTSYTYDLDGRQETAGTTGYGYNGFGELTSATTPSDAVSYVRDGLGRVASRTAGGISTALGYEAASNDLTAAQPEAGPVTTMVRSPGGHLLAQATDGAITQQAWDSVHGDLVVLRNDTNGAATWTADYDPFGAITATTGSASVPLGYQSQYTDPATGLVDMGARHYSPATGRFITRDSIVGALTAPVSLHRYLYANADPINMFDPDGHWPDWLDNAVDWVVDTASTVGNWIADTASAVGDWIADTASSAWSTATETWDQVTGAVASGFEGAKRDAAKRWQQAKSLAAKAAAGTNAFWEEHGDQITAIAASLAVGIVVFAGCEAVAIALTAGTATPLCAALAGAAGGALYGHMSCPEQANHTQCVAVGAVAGGVAGLTGGLVAGAGGGAFTVGAAAGFTGDATDQLLTTGEYDPVRGLAATLTGGALGWVGGKIGSPFTRGGGRTTGSAVEESVATTRPGTQGSASNAPTPTPGGTQVPAVVYRGGSRTPDNLTPRPGVDHTGLSTFGSLDAFKPGTKVQPIDLSKLKSLQGVPDAPPPGHVSIAPRDMSQLSGWANMRGTGQVHPYTQELLDALMPEIRIPR
jgi:RHS repeat-associated protein